MTTKRPQRDRAGFTLIELLVTIGVIAVLLGIIGPAYLAARGSARQAECSSNLRQLGAASLVFANDHRGALCTGPSDNRRDRAYGPIDEKGWLADLTLGDYARPGAMLCPSQSARLGGNLVLTRLNDNPQKPFTEQDRDALLDRGVNSNYAQTWFMGFTSMKNNLDQNHEHDPRFIQGVVGPLNQNSLGAVPPTIVPLFGDAGARQGESTTVRGEAVGTVTPLTAGPVRTGDAGTFTRQDYSDLGPAHGRVTSVGGRDGHAGGIGQVAFADGHIAAFRDTNRDGGFGFDIDANGIPRFTPQGAPRYADPDVERGLFGGWVLSGEYR